MDEQQGVRLHYSTWRTSAGNWGCIAIYVDDSGTFMKITYNGVDRCYEQIAEPGEV